MFQRLTEEVLPYYNCNKKKQLIKLVFHQVPQAVHPQSAIVHESVCAMRHLYNLPTTNAYQSLLMASADQFTDAICCNENRIQTTARLVELASTIEGVSSVNVLQRMTPVFTDASPNNGSPSSRVLKFYVKQHIQLGIYDAPKCRVNGLIIDAIDSDWSLAQWKEFLDPMLMLAQTEYKRK